MKPLLGAVGYIRRGRSRCFVCAIVEGDLDYPHHLIYDDRDAIAFLVKHPTMWGHVLVCPKAHREQSVGDFDDESYVQLQRTIRLVGEAVTRAVPCERLYVMSLGSQQLNRHVHWHLVPLRPGVPLLKQQLRALSEVLHGVIVCPEPEWDRLARRMRQELEA